MCRVDINPLKSEDDLDVNQIVKPCIITVEEEITDAETSEYQQQIVVLEKKGENLLFAMITFFLCSCVGMYVIFIGTPILNMAIDSTLLIVSILLTVAMFYRSRKLTLEIFEISQKLR